MHSNEADAMANSVDPDQTASSEAVWSWSALFAETYLSQYIEFLRYFTSFSTEFQSYLDNDRVTIKDCVQWISVHDWKISTSSMNQTQTD